MRSSKWEHATKLWKYPPKPTGSRRTEPMYTPSPVSAFRYAGNVATSAAVVALAAESNPVLGALMGEVCGTSDVPAGVVNILTGLRDELIPHIAAHRDIDAVHAANVGPEHAKALREGAGENLKRVTVRDLPPGAGPAGGWFDDQACAGPSWIEPFVEMKTVWHPAAP